MPRLFASSRVLLDVLEWYSHSIFLEDSTQHDILYASEQVERMTDTLQLPTEGRIWNRLLLSMLVQNVCTRSTMDGEASLYNMSKSDWLDLLSNLQTCRAQLLKGNASTHPPQGQDTPDPDYLQLPMFQEVYMEVEDLVTCHVVLSDFRCALNQSNGDNVSQLLQDFTKALPKQFHGDLVPYLAKDVLSSPKKHTNVARKLSSDLEFLLLKQNDKLYSYNTLQRKCKTLCRTWNECILGIPTLAKLGYGGMAKSRFTEGEHDDDDHDDTKTVSSWGMDEEEEAARKEVEESESDDYHTADEEDDDDDRKTRSHVHHEKVLPMEIRPRESWKEDFTMIENLQQHVRTDDDDEEENEFDDEPPRKRKSHVRQVTDDPVIQAARERRQKRRRLRNRRISSRTPSATSTAVTKKRKHDDDESSTTESEDAPSDALDRLPTYAETKRKQQQQQQLPSRTFTKQQIQVLQEGVETHGDNAWDIIIGEAKGILRDKKPWQCRQYYQQNMMSEEL